jgi:hypothetical protein
LNQLQTGSTAQFYSGRISMLIMAQNAQPFLGGVNFPNGHVLSAYLVWR